VFLFNPFDDVALDEVLDRLAERPAGGEEWVLYHTPVHAARLQARDYVLVAEVPEGGVYRRRHALPSTSRSRCE
jgi:hypothetical protein